MSIILQTYFVRSICYTTCARCTLLNPSCMCNKLLRNSFTCHKLCSHFLLALCVPLLCSILFYTACARSTLPSHSFIRHELLATLSISHELYSHLLFKARVTPCAPAATLPGNRFIFHESCVTYFFPRTVQPYFARKNVTKDHTLLAFYLTPHVPAAYYQVTQSYVTNFSQLIIPHESCSHILLASHVTPRAADARC